MSVELAVTRSCHHCPIIETELDKLGIPYSIRYVEEDAELQKKHNIKGSANILVDSELVFREITAMSDLKAYFKKKA
jgi:glutaredoxin